MSKLKADSMWAHDGAGVAASLAAREYRPALAAQLVDEGHFYQAIEICKELLASESMPLSVRLIYARALHGSGMDDSAMDQCYAALSTDPNNLVALKLLGDIKYSGGDELGAMVNYERIRELDPFGLGLCSSIRRRTPIRTRTITLVREGETTDKAVSKPLPDIPFFTETLGDLYFSQGHARLAAEVFRHLKKTADTPGLAKKLSDAEEKI